jgi:hypothetical protein
MVNPHPTRKKILGTPLVSGKASLYYFVKNEELHDLYYSTTIVRVIKSRRMRCAGHVAQKGEGSGVYKVLVGKPEGNRPLGDPGVDGSSESGMWVYGLD